MKVGNCSNGQSNGSEGKRKQNKETMEDLKKREQEKKGPPCGDELRNE